MDKLKEKFRKLFPHHDSTYTACAELTKEIAVKFVEWKIKIRIRSSPVSGQWIHWFPNALSKQYTTSELFTLFLEQENL